MDFRIALNELREELQLVDDAIAVFERLAAAQQPRRGRPPKWLVKRRADTANPLTENPESPPKKEPSDDILRRRLADAEQAYKSATQEHHRLMSIAKELDPTSPDGNQAVRQAMRIQRVALERYEQAAKDLATVYRANKPGPGAES